HNLPEAGLELCINGEGKRGASANFTRPFPWWQVVQLAVENGGFIGTNGDPWQLPQPVALIPR
ncbi:MAG: hypothetical protein QSU88_03450, partial [Candidatus Methanoperedens sp.]|nr:hypothetical protein [Candidatus Methanoperedens sp.]